MHKHGVGENAFIYIADSAMVTEANLAQIGERTRFITRLPATYNEHERVILEAIATDAWEDVGPIAQTAPTKNRPGNVPEQEQGGYSAERILRTYKEQNAIEKNFGFLKDDQIINALVP